jgi:hypothetical protein
MKIIKLYMREILLQSAALRRERKYREAIDLIEKNLNRIEDDSMLNAFKEIVRAAEDGGLSDYVKKYMPLLKAKINEPKPRKYPYY